MQTDVDVSFAIDNFDPTRFHDIHCLLYAGAALLYAVKFTDDFQTMKWNLVIRFWDLSTLRNVIRAVIPPSFTELVPQ